MSLSQAYEFAKAGLFSAEKGTVIVSRNIGNASIPTASVKSALNSTGSGGGVHFDGVQNAVDLALLGSAIQATAKAAEAEAFGTALDEIGQVFGASQDGTGIVQELSDLRDRFIVAGAAAHSWEGDRLFLRMVTTRSGSR